MGKSIAVDINRQVVAVEADSCSLGMGVVCGQDWFYVDWAADAPDIHALHINHKETAAIVVAARRWAADWEGKHVTVFTDNQTAMHIINRGTSAQPRVMELIRELFWLSVLFNFTLSAVYIKGEHNIFADTVSRLGRNNCLLQWILLNQIVCSSPDVDMFADKRHLHMPPNSLITLLPQIRRLGNWRSNSTRGSRNLEPMPWLAAQKEPTGRNSEPTCPFATPLPSPPPGFGGYPTPLRGLSLKQAKF